MRKSNLLILPARTNGSNTEDISPLLSVGVNFSEDDAIVAFDKIWNELIVRLSGEPWKISEKAVEELRKARIPNLL